MAPTLMTMNHLKSYSPKYKLLQMALFIPFCSSREDFHRHSLQCSHSPSAVAELLVSLTGHKIENASFLMPEYLIPVKNKKTMLQ